MAPPQGIIQFPGIDQTIDGTFTLGHGVTPSVAKIRCLLSSPNVPATGTMAISYGGFSKRFKDCRVASASWQTGTQGNVWTLIIHDRRHRWKRGEISGVYNQRLPNGKVDPDTEKTPQELAKLLFEALGESRPDVSQLPNQSRPEKAWDFANPATELQRLCSELQCRVVLGLDDKIRVKRINEGRPLTPVPGSFIEGGVALTPDLLPHTIKIVMGPVRVQSQLYLRAVGLDVDGRIRPIDDLSYRPANGWGTDIWGFRDVTAGFGDQVANLNEAVKKRNANALARRTVFRWYEIERQANNTTEVPKIAELIKGLPKEWEAWQLLPVSGDLVETVKDEKGFDVPAPAYVNAAYWPHDGAGSVTSGSVSIEDGWTLDEARGIVKFDDIMVRFDGNGNAIPAAVYLTCSYQLITNDKANKGAPVRFTHERIVNRRAPNTDVEIVRRDDLTPTIQATYDINHLIVRTVDNFEELKKEAEKAIDDRLRGYALEAPQDFSYAGFVPIEPDGAIQQVTFTTDSSGARTRASRLQEHNMDIPGHDEGVRRREQDDDQRVKVGRRQIGGRQAEILRSFHLGYRLK